MLTKRGLPQVALVLTLTWLALFSACSNDKIPPTQRDAGADAGGTAPPGIIVMSDASVSHEAGAHDSADATIVPQGPSPFGKRCDSDADCATGLICLQDDQDRWLAGGPAHGYCSLDCSADPSLCQRFDGAAHCLGSTIMTQSYCFKGCTLGDTSGEQKCGDRQDLSCTFIAASPTCLPNCGGDQDCPAGRSCNHTHGVCVTAVTTGDPFGTECDPAGDNTCSGYCSSLSNGTGACTGLCVLGAPYACDVPEGLSDPVGLPLCMTFNGLDRAGDTGICVQRCHCNEDCGHRAAYCDFTQADTLGGWGACLFTDTVDAGTAGPMCGAQDGGVSDAAIDGDR